MRCKIAGTHKNEDILLLKPQNKVQDHTLVILSLSFIGGLFFAKPMRDKNYITMMDPFQRKYGKSLSGLLAIVPFISEIMWVPVTLTSLGKDKNMNTVTFFSRAVK